MTLKELKELFAKAETFGFADDQITVDMIFGGSRVAFKSAKAVVSATENEAKPTLIIQLEHKGSLILENR
jgi:hypothetical protein